MCWRGQKDTERHFFLFLCLSMAGSYFHFRNMSLTPMYIMVEGDGERWPVQVRDGGVEWHRKCILKRQHVFWK